MRTPAERWLLPIGLVATLTQAISLDTNSASSIKDAASAIAFNMMTYYYGNQTGNNPGVLAQPYYWWEAGGMFGHIVDYYYYTGDASYNAETIQAITWQAGTDGEFMPQNQTLDEGNDDQVFWAFTAMDAAELKFPDPGSQWPSYTAMGQAVFNLQAERWDPSNCGGGLRWQITSINTGYDYKNTPSNMGFFQLAARLARYTGNQTYVDWAEKSWTWFSTSSLLNATTSSYRIYDGAGIEADCQKPNPAQYSYNYGITLAGLAYMYNHTSDPKWLTPLYGVLNGTFDVFFPENKIISEVGCEPYNNCNTDGLTFKSFTIRWLAVTTQLVPETAGLIWPYIVASANGAAQQCDGADTDGQVCGYHWNTATYDGSLGLGQQMSALATIQANLLTASDLAPPLTLDTGGTSKSDPSAGSGSNDGGVTPDGQVATSKITTGDRAGAGIITAILLVATVGGAYWLAVM